MTKIKTFLLLAIFGILFFTSLQVSAHGYVVSPASRGYQGSLDKNSLGYAAAVAKYGTIINEPQSLEALKGFPGAGPADGRIASANGALGGDTTLDNQTADRWTKTNISAGINAFTWKYTAYHKTAKWHYYMTKPGWDPNKPLSRADLELIGEVIHNGTPPTDNTPHYINIPQNRQGYHIIVAIWDIADTVNAFYNVIDVNVTSGTGPATPPNTPTGLAAQNITSTSAKITWTPQSDAASYVVFRNDQTVQEVTTPVFQDQGLLPSTTYTYKVQAKGSSGLTSAKSNGLAVLTNNANTIEKPTAPTNLHSMGVTINSVSLMWGPSTHTQGIKHYQVFRNGVKITETTQTDFLNTGLSSDTEYSYTVKAVALNDQISDASNELKARTKKIENLEKPTAPTNLHSMSKTETSVSLMWGASTHSQGIKNYQVFRNGAKITETTQVSFVNTGLSSDTEYSYTVKAVALNDQISDASNELKVKTNKSNNNGQLYCGAQVYKATSAYPTPHTKVFYSCKIWENKWYANPNDLPGANAVWEEVGVCTEGSNCTLPTTYCGAQPYSSIKTYSIANTKVFYACKIWENKWYANPGEIPGQSATWKLLSNCTEGPNCNSAKSNNQDDGLSVIVAGNLIDFSPESYYGKINEVNVFDTRGTLILSAKKPAKNSINISSLQTGVYFIRILYSDGGSVTKTIKK